MKNLYFRILTRPCFIHIGKTLTSNPGLLTFTPAMPTIFANTANPVFIPVSIFHQTMVEELRGAGGQMWKGTNLSLTRTHTDIAPPNPYASWPITLLQKIHSRCWRSSPAKKKYTASPYTPPLVGVDVHSVTIPFHAKKLSLSSRSFKNREGGGWEKGGGWGREPKATACQGAGLWDFCWLGFCKKFGKVWEILTALFLTFCPPFLSLRSK